MKFKTLWKGDYISVVSPEDADFEAVHGKDCIIVIPVLRKGKDIYTVIRQEYCPPYFIKDEKPRLYYTVISGQIEEGEEPEKAMIRELEEETGIKAIDYKILAEKGPIPIDKSSTARVTFYVIDITKAEKVPIEGDGSEYEAKSKSTTMSIDSFKKVVDSKENIDYLLYSAYHILMATIGES